MRPQVPLRAPFDASSPTLISEEPEPIFRLSSLNCKSIHFFTGSVSDFRKCGDLLCFRFSYRFRLRKFPKSAPQDGPRKALGWGKCRSKLRIIIFFSLGTGSYFTHRRSKKRTTSDRPRLKSFGFEALGLVFLIFWFKV